LENPVKYFLPIGEQRIAMNALIGNQLTFRYDGQILCIRCGRKTKKSFAQGFCYPCMRDAPEASECIIHPELCLAHEGKGRDPDWEREHHLKEHFVYLAISSGLKVGVTRSDQIPTRWIDQGASSAACIAKTPNRYIAGIIEVALKKYISDKTNWRKMLQNEIDQADIAKEKENLTHLLTNELTQFILPGPPSIAEIQYPVIQFPTKVTSVGFDKNPEITGKLYGIKGQYLIFNDGRVLNLRKHGGYVLHMMA
jgi:hypothetical protein